MAILTHEASRFLEETLDRSEREDVAVRLGRSASGWRLRIDSPKDGDEVFEREGRVLLVMSEELAEALVDAVIDLREKDQRRRLVITQG